MARRLHLLANSKSGKGHGENLSELVQRICKETGHEVIIYEINDPQDLEAKAKEAVAIARKSPDTDVVVAAGGDGTLRSIAEQVRGTGATFGVIPVGTFNFFARTHLVPEDHEGAVRLLLTGNARPIRLGSLNGRTFLINASLGIYAKSIREREENTAKFGRNRFVVIASTLKTMLSRHRLLHVRLTSDNKEKRIDTPMIFVGNNALQMRNLSLPVADCFKTHRLAVVVMKPVRGVEMLRVLSHGFARTLDKEERVSQFCTESLTIESRRTHQTVALDGELFKMTSPFAITSDSEAVRMITPEPISGEPA